MSVLVAPFPRKTMWVQPEICHRAKAFGLRRSRRPGGLAPHARLRQFWPGAHRGKSPSAIYSRLRLGTDQVCKPRATPSACCLLLGSSLLSFTYYSDGARAFGEVPDVFCLSLALTALCET